MRDLQAIDDAGYFLDEYAQPPSLAIYAFRSPPVPEVVARIPNESRSITGWTVGANAVFVALGNGLNTGEL